MGVKRAEPGFFELEREKLIGNVSENLGKLISSVNVLNRNIEANVAVGSQFDGVSRLWREFERVLAHSSDDQLPTTLPPVESCAPGRDTADGEESFGLAPGAGSRSYMQ
ncbi:MAG: hypothetical protein CYPHOPRED_006083 [Cyphobasidiales sp. Tagirdzhanova-0007]|nr:MAG: hypothetical protein CYPHOPRED_006083 [Cyphobasidiales sp. Tagirdzhanova-0007]